MLELLRGRLQFSPATTEAFILPFSGTTHVQLLLCDDMGDNMTPQRNRRRYLGLGLRGFDLEICVLTTTNALVGTSRFSA